MAKTNILMVVGAGALALAATVSCDPSGDPKDTGGSKAVFAAKNVRCNDDCTVLGDYCITVAADLCNDGQAGGTGFATCTINDVTKEVGRRSSASLPLGVGQCRPVTINFPEAELGPDYACSCTAGAN